MRGHLVTLALALGACAPAVEREQPAVGRVSFAVDDGAPNPPAKLVAVSNTGDCDSAVVLTATTTDGAPWLVVPGSATVAARSSAMVSVAVDPHALGLGPGLYLGTVELSSTCVDNGRQALGSPGAISVTLSVTVPDAGRAPSDAGAPADGGSPADAGDGTCDAPFVVTAFPSSRTDVTRGTSQYDHAGCTTAASGPENLYRLELPSGGTLRVTVTPLDGGLIPVVLAGATCPLYPPGADCSAGTTPGETTRLLVTSVTAGTQFLAVDGLEGSKGAYRLDLALTPATTDPVGSQCSSPGVLTLVAGTADLEANTDGAQDDGAPTRDAFGTLCAYPGAPDRSYRLTLPPTDGGLWDVSLAAWSQDELQGTVALAVQTSACDVDAGVACVTPTGPPSLGLTARWSGQLPANQDAFAWVDSAFNANGTPFHLRARTAPAGSAVNDECPAAIPLSANATYQGSTLGATNSLGEFANSYASGACQTSGSQGGPDVFFSFTAASTGPATVTVQPERGVDVAVAVLSTCAGSSCLGIADGFGVGPQSQAQAETVTFQASQGASYVVVVDHSDSAAGRADRGWFTVSVSQ
ncbi:MAG: hypothetical protein K1X89_06665 [Myxococcaceae bacterium]|nr:hypothetical protein [Myxococcaceae bacterium]